MCGILFVTAQTLDLPCEQARILLKGWLDGRVGGFIVAEKCDFVSVDAKTTQLWIGVTL